MLIIISLKNDNTKKEDKKMTNNYTDGKEKQPAYLKEKVPVKPKTMAINPYYKEVYYQSSLSELKEPPQVIEHRHVVWNQMMNLSMQNAIIQMRKPA